VFVAGDLRAAKGLTTDGLAAARVAQLSHAVLVLTNEDRKYWWCLDRFFWEDEGLASEDVFALAYERQLRTQRRLERAHDAVKLREPPARRRAGIPLEARRAVWERDGGRCVECDSNFELQFDHVIPVVMGGATTVENLQVLCGSCNRTKGGTLG